MDNLSTYHPVSSNKSNVNLTVTPNCVNQRNHTHITNNCFSNASKAKSLRIMHQNIRGIAHRVEEFLTSITLTTPQVICLSEHHLRKEEINSICLEQYTLGAHFCRRTYKQRGVAIYISSDVQFNSINLEQFSKEKDFEICALKLQTASNSFIVICIY